MTTWAGALQDHSNALNRKVILPQYPIIARMYASQQQLAYAPTPYSYTPSSNLAASINLDAVSQPKSAILAGALSLIQVRRR
jgi:hypothetical protein